EELGLQRRIDEGIGDGLGVATGSEGLEERRLCGTFRGESPKALRAQRIDLGDRLEADDAGYLLDEIGLDADGEAVGGRDDLPALGAALDLHAETLERLHHQRSRQRHPE